MRKVRGQKGLTLVEVMVSLLIVSLSVLAMYTMFINGLDLIREQEHRKVVAELAKSRLEACSYAALIVDTVPRNLGGSYEDVIVFPSDEQVGIFANCEVIVAHSTEININTGKPYYSEVSIRYDWEELSGREYDMEFHAIY
jgi:prepilin-type N-terminal cleavage/methylation domain-containing protein